MLELTSSCFSKKSFKNNVTANFLWVSYAAMPLLLSVTS